jgi:hypothetical protein
MENDERGLASLIFLIALKPICVKPKCLSIVGTHTNF